MAAAQLGLALGEPEMPVPLAAVTLPPPRFAPPAFADAATETRVRHCFGRSYPDLVRGLRGAFAPAPDAVARPAWRN
jgi:hypothetical protein